MGRILVTILFIASLVAGTAACQYGGGGGGGGGGSPVPSVRY